MVCLTVLIQQNTIKSKVLVCWTRNLNMLLWVYYVPLTGIFVIQGGLKGALICFFFYYFHTCTSIKMYICF